MKATDQELLEDLSTALELLATVALARGAAVPLAELSTRYYWQDTATTLRTLSDTLRANFARAESCPILEDVGEGELEDENTPARENVWTNPGPWVCPNCERRRCRCNDDGDDFEDCPWGSPEGRARWAWGSDPC